MRRRGNALALVGVMAACLALSTAVRADEVILFPSDTGGGANAVRILSGGGNHVGEDIVSVYHRGGNMQSGFVLFDLSSIPAGKTITKATFTLWHDSGIWGTGDLGNDTQVFRVTKPWVQWQVTWTRASGYRPSNSVLWDIPGGDFAGITGQIDGSDPYGAATLNLDDLANGPAAGRIAQLDIDVTSLITEWYTGTSPNYGLLVTAPDPNGLHFKADRGDDPTVYPTLTVDFQ